MTVAAGTARNEGGALPEERETQQRRIRLDLSYDGTDFHGWATQPGIRTVQGEIESALALIFRRSVTLTVAGRTDAGVHARHQVAHMDVCAQAWRDLAPRRAQAGDEYAAAEGLVRRLNALLGQARARWARAHTLSTPHTFPDIVIAQATPVAPTFDARFCALRRHYCYRISEGILDPLRRSDVLKVSGPLDTAAMNAGAKLLLGEHDFLSYCRPREGATTIRTLERLDFKRINGMIECWVTADAFCHSMVRSLVGASLEVGRGKRLPEWMGELLAARSRSAAAPIAPAHGLSLERVDYPPEADWGTRAHQARARREESGGCCG